MDLPPPAPTPVPAPRTAPLALAALGVLLLGLLAARGYGPRLAPRPTEFHPVAHRVDLNTADKPELVQVPGIGPGLADAILTHRRDRGPFATVDNLTAVKGVGGKTVEKVRPWVTVGDSPPEVERLERKPAKPPAPARGGKLRPGDPPVDVNAADEAELQRLPGVGPTLARRIVDVRGTDRFKSVEDLRKVKGIGVKTLENLRPYVVCRGPG